MRILSLEPLSGAAGDMILASLIDLGADAGRIQQILTEAGLSTVDIAYQRKVCRHGLQCGYILHTEIPQPQPAGIAEDDHTHGHAHGAEHDHAHGAEHDHAHGAEHDHAHGAEHDHAHGAEHDHAHGAEHDHAHGAEHDHAHGHSHVHGAEHSHDHARSHVRYHHAPSAAEAPRFPHEHRGLSAILEIIARCQVAPLTRQRAEKIFRRLAEAEAAIHGVTPEQVHFHEVGAVDSIVDILGSCIALEQLQIERIFCPGHKIGYGTVRCAHGVMPVPAPATARLLEGYPVTRLPIASELTTPTGAAILTALSEGEFYRGRLRLLKTGYGHGRKEFEQMPNIVRALLFETEAGLDGAGLERIAQLECECDDQTAECAGFLMERLLAAGALDVAFQPVQMKKNRPGMQLRVLCRMGQETELARLILAESSSIGLRITYADRIALPRREVTVDTPWGKLAAKQISRPNGRIEIVPEYEAARSLAEAHRIPLREVMDLARSWRPENPLPPA